MIDIISVLISSDPHPLGEFQQDLISNSSNKSLEDRASLEEGIELILSLYDSSPHKVSQAYGLYRL